MVIFPITFVASTFVPVNTLPGVLKTIAEWNPVTSMSEALRELFGNPTADSTPTRSGRCSTRSLYTLIWIVAIVVVCAPLAIWTYQRISPD